MHYLEEEALTELIKNLGRITAALERLAAQAERQAETLEAVGKWLKVSEENNQ